MLGRNFASDVLIIINIYFQQIGKPCPIKDIANQEKNLIYIESQLTLIELKNLLNLQLQSDYPHDGNPSPFFKFLAERWESRIKNTRAAYPYHPQNPANLACQELAMKLFSYYPESSHPYKILMPTLIQKPMPSPPLHHYILNDDNTALINVKEYLINLINKREYYIIINSTCHSLSATEIQRICHHSSEVEAICHLLDLNEQGEALQLPLLSVEEKEILISRINHVFDDNQESNIFLTGCNQDSFLLLHRQLFSDSITLTSLINKLTYQHPILWKVYLNIFSNEELISLIFNEDKSKQEMLHLTQGPLLLIKTLSPLLKNPLLYQQNHDQQNRVVLFIFLELYIRLRNIGPEYAGFFGMVIGYAKNQKIDAANWLSDHLVSDTLPQLTSLLKADQSISSALTHGTLGDFTNQIIALTNHLISPLAKPYLSLNWH